MANGKKGDVVVSKSGGPLMDIQHIRSNGILECSWFSGTELKHGQFASESVNPKPEGSQPGVTIARG